MEPAGSLEQALAPLMQRLGLHAPRGPVQIRPGLAPGLRDLPARLGFKAYPPLIDSRGAGAALFRWTGPHDIVCLFVSSISAEHLRQTLLLAGLNSTHGPESLLEPGSPNLGDASYVLGGAAHYFSRGNLGAMVRCERSAQAGIDLGRRLDALLQEGNAVAPAQLAALAPRITELRAAPVKLDLGQTARVELVLEEAWRARCKLFFELDSSQLDPDRREDHTILLKAKRPGPAAVTGCAVDTQTLLSSAKSVTLTLEGTEPAPPDDDEPVEAPPVG